MTQHDERYDEDAFTPDFAGADRLLAAGRVAPPTPEVIRSALTAVRAAAAVETVGADTTSDAVPAEGPVHASVPRPGLSRRRMLLAAGGVAAAAAAGAVLLPRTGFGDSREHPTTAPEFLQRVAYVAADATRTEAPYWKVDSVLEAGPPPEPARSHSHHPNGVKRHRVSWLSRTGMTSRTASGKVTSYPTSLMTWSIAEKDITWDDLRTLPTTPAALRTRLLGGRPKQAGWVALFNGAGNLLALAPAGPELRAAVYELLAEIPGIRLGGGTKDSVGRAGTVVELDTEDHRGRLVIDPKTALLLESGEYALDGGRNARLVSRSTFLSVGPAWTAPRADAPKI
ncbi:CU044_5270 family protein [Streptomyces sp. NPDC091209]|uniref:CU044_5270 family protein n=1 Tax=Streptomyces sp. NPDC091209 TaxID=3365974 RepID=UPI00381EDE84